MKWLELTTGVTATERGERDRGLVLERERQRKNAGKSRKKTNERLSNFLYFSACFHNISHVNLPSVLCLLRFFPFVPPYFSPLFLFCSVLPFLFHVNLLPPLSFFVCLFFFLPLCSPCQLLFI